MVSLRTFNIWRTFLFHKGFFVVKEGFSDDMVGSLWMVLCGTKNGSSMTSLEELIEAPLFVRVYFNAKRRFTLAQAVSKSGPRCDAKCTPSDT